MNEGLDRLYQLSELNKNTWVIHFSGIFPGVLRGIVKPDCSTGIKIGVNIWLRETALSFLIKTHNWMER